MDGRIQLAQKQNDDGDDKPNSNAAMNAIKRKQMQGEQAKQKALQQQQNANKARDEAVKNRQNAIKKQQNQAQQAKQNALKQQQLQGEQAKQKALQQQQNAIKARDAAQKQRQDAIKNKQNQADQAKQNAIKQRQDAIKARDEAVKNRQDDIKNKQNQAEQAKQNAIKQQQLQAEQAKQKALQQQQNAIKARDDAIKNRPSGPNIPPSLGGNRGNAQQNQQDAIRAREEEAARARENAAKAREQAIRQKQLDAEAARQNAQKATQGAGPKGNLSLGMGARRRVAHRQKRSIEAPPTRSSSARDQARDFNKGGDKNRGGGREVENWRPDGAKKFDGRPQRPASERTLFGGKRRDIIENPTTVIVRQNDRSFIRHDESNRFKRTGREVRRDRRKDGLTTIVTMGLAGALIYSRCRMTTGASIGAAAEIRDGREIVLIDNRNYYGHHHGSRFDQDRDSYRDALRRLAAAARAHSARRVHRRL